METATAETVQVQTDAPVDSLGGEVRVFFGPEIGSVNDFRFSSSDSTIYLPEGSYEVWYHQDGYTCPHEEITVTEGSTNSVELKVEEAPEVEPAWLAGAHRIGICGATSTPRWLMQEVADAVADLAEKNM